ncbi:MAG: UDP-N-acetylmuramoyl-L-alanyl-D-glutamate--2,6-diaminopimelate ligase [Ruminococcaceae bacterium]|nr:UDP-N-acetylmuramoyl-L-alanyl-D-glutamate--2,6-diaminopimelate ligase [Oscillospiraceae bacterium]
MKVSELFGKAGLSYPPETGDIEIDQIVTDSRRVQPGCLFLCIRGLHTDGHGYADDAIKAGAAVIVAEQVRDVCVGGAAAYIMLENTRKAAALLYNALYGDPVSKLKIIGVTGTNGKTSVCVLLTELFRAAGYRCGLVGTVCCQSADGVALSPQNADTLANMTTPDPEELYRMLAQMVRDGVEYVFMEVTSHALALSKVDAILFDTAVFTNLTRDHLDFHHTMEEYFLAKRRLFNICRRAVINRDDEAGERLLSTVRCPAVSVSLTEGDYCALDIVKQGTGGSVFRFQAPDEEIEIALPIPGEFSVMNALTAGAVAAEYGIPLALIRRTLEQTRGAEGRMERLLLAENAGLSVVIDYAHTPDALEKLLQSVRGFRRQGERIVLLFGCGGDRDRDKRKQMGQIASQLADLVIVTSDNSRGEDPDGILTDILKGIDKERPYTVIRDRRLAIETAVLSAKPRDILVLAGKGHERYEIDRKGRHPFDEREIVREALKRRHAAGAEE